MPDRMLSRAIYLIRGGFKEESWGLRIASSMTVMLCCSVVFQQTSRTIVMVSNAMAPPILILFLTYDSPLTSQQLARQYNMVIISPILERDLTKGDVIWNAAGGCGRTMCFVGVHSNSLLSDAPPEFTFM